MAAPLKIVANFRPRTPMRNKNHYNSSPGSSHESLGYKLLKTMITMKYHCCSDVARFLTSDWLLSDSWVVKPLLLGRIPWLLLYHLNTAKLFSTSSFGCEISMVAIREMSSATSYLATSFFNIEGTFLFVSCIRNLQSTRISPLATFRRGR